MTIVFFLISSKNVNDDFTWIDTFYRHSTGNMKKLRSKKFIVSKTRLQFWMWQPYWKLLFILDAFSVPYHMQQFRHIYQIDVNVLSFMRMLLGTPQTRTDYNAGYHQSYMGPITLQLTYVKSHEIKANKSS